MILNLYGVDGIIFQTLASGFKESHLESKLKFQVVEAKKVGGKFKEAVKKAYNAKFLDDADMIIRFAVPKAEETPVEETPPAEETPADETQAETPPAEETPAEETPPEETQTEEVPADDDNGEESKKDGKEKVDEAETTATGADLKKKILDTVKRRLFKEGDDTVELSDLDGFLEGYDVSFIKIALKEATKNAGDGETDDGGKEGEDSEEKDDSESSEDDK